MRPIPLVYTIKLYVTLTYYHYHCILTYISFARVMCVHKYYLRIFFCIRILCKEGHGGTSGVYKAENMYRAIDITLKRPLPSVFSLKHNL